MEVLINIKMNADNLENIEKKKKRENRKYQLPK